jgi:hypothetical protein
VRESVRADTTIRVRSGSFVVRTAVVQQNSARFPAADSRVGADEILYRFTVEDMLLYTQAWTAETVMKRSVDRMFDYACHEGNYGLTNILRGGRAMDRRREQQARPVPEDGDNHSRAGTRSGRGLLLNGMGFGWAAPGRCICRWLNASREQGGTT